MRSLRQALVVVPAVILAGGACDAINGPLPLQVSVAARPETLAPGDTTRIAVTIRNFGPRAVTFDSNCTIYFQVRPVGDSTDVANPGAIPCLRFLQAVTLGPFESFEKVFVWNAMRRWCNGTTCVFVPVPSGTYGLTGSLSYEGEGLISPAVPLAIR